MFTNSVQKSAMPVLGANTAFDGKPAGSSSDSQHPFAKIQPLIVKEIEGIKVAIIGITTPGMSFWLPREFTVGIDFQLVFHHHRKQLLRAVQRPTPSAPQSLRAIPNLSLFR